MAAIVLVSGLVSVFFAEKLPLSDGLGWDGVFYGSVARDFARLVLHDGVDVYRLQRVLPSFVIYYALGAMRSVRSVPEVILAFGIYHVVLMTLVPLLWKGIADRLGLTLSARWLGFVTLYVNYAVLKLGFYQPVSTDLTALFFGVLCLYLYLADRRMLLCLAAIVGSFDWPIVGMSVACLLASPRGEIRSAGAHADKHDQTRSWLSGALAAALAISLSSGFLYMYFVRGIRQVGNGFTIPVVASLIPLSLALYIAHIFYTWRVILGDVTVGYVVRWLRGVRWRDLALAVLAVGTPVLITKLLPTQPNGTQDARSFGRFIIFLPNTRPYVFMVSHVEYYGPALLLLFVLWRRIAAMVSALGPGAVAFATFSLLFSLTPESRHSIFALPFFVALMLRAADERSWPVTLYWFLGAAALLVSKVWFQINQTTGFHPPYDSAWMWAYYISAGPWMMNEFYVLHLIVSLAIALVAWTIVRRSRHQQVPEEGLPSTASSSGGWLASAARLDRSGDA